MEVSATMSKGAIALRAKDDTYLAVRTFLVGHEANAKSKYEMQADERDTHERKLLKSIGAAVSVLEAELDRHKVTDSMEEGKDAFSVSYEVSDRFDLGKKKTLEKLTEEYIYRRVVYEWWLVNYPDAAPPFLVSAQSILESIRKCFSLSNPYESVGGVKYKCLQRRNYRVLLIYKEEVVNEIHRELLKLSRTRTDGNGVPDMNLQTNEMEDEGLITRYVNRYVNRAGERMNAYLYELSNTVDNDMEERVPVYEYKLLMPDGWDGRLFEQLAEEVHGYIVNSCLYEWMKTVSADAAVVYGREAQTAYDNIKHVISVRRRGCIRKPLQPF